MSITMKHIV